jgi:hypothetical protein
MLVPFAEQVSAEADALRERQRIDHLASCSHRQDHPGEPARIAEERFSAYALSPGSIAAAAIAAGSPS